jgi:hypothetical protein
MALGRQNHPIHDLATSTTELIHARRRRHRQGSAGTDLRNLAGAEHPSEPLGPLNRWNLDELDIVISHKHSPPLLTLLISGPSRPYTPFALFSLLIVLFVPTPRVELWEGNRCRSNLLPAVTEAANPPSEFIYQFRCTQQPALHGSAT